MDVLVLGTVAFDDVKTPSGRRKKMLGGSAVHFSMSCRLFSRVHLVSVVGEDFPQSYIQFLKERNLCLSSLAIVKGRTFSWQGDYCQDLNSAQTLKTELGVFACFQPRLARRQKIIKYLFLANVDPDLQHYVIRCMVSPRLIALDSMNYWIKNKLSSLKKVLKNVDIYFANEQEAKDLSGEISLVKAAKALRSLGPKMVLIKKGEHGVLFYSDKFFCCLPAFPVAKIVDPTGAGDTFAGGFMGYLSRRQSLELPVIKNALAFGTIAASFNVQGFGLERTASLTLGELKKRMQEFKSYVCF